jgi:hypothetical protein
MVVRQEVAVLTSDARADERFEQECRSYQQIVRRCAPL